MKLLTIAIWVAGAFYSALCLGIPEIRPYLKGSLFWTGKQKTLGLLSCVGFAMVFWCPALIYAGIVTGLIPEGFMSATYLAILLGIIVAMVGSWVDLAS
jgi:hypothetical protein